MTDQTPSNSSLPPLGSSAPSGSTPPPPPPPMPPSAKASAGSDSVTPQPVATGSSPSRPKRSLLFGLVAVLAVGGVVAGVIAGSGGGSSDESATAGAEAPELEDAATVATSPTTEAPATTVAPATTEVPETTAAPSTVAPTTAPPTTAPPTTEAPPTTQAAPAYPTLPDGSPEPIIAIYDGPVVRATGWVPSPEKAAQLEALALANSTDPNAQVEANWSFDPAVPLNIGTRVIEMNSPRFPPGSADVTPEHAEQLNRVAGVMNLLPNVTATVVGHADQLGDANANYVLSEARAVSVVRYLVSQGVDPARLSARAVGEQDLLAEDESEASLALNRRTEFIFYGLLAD